MTLPTGGTLLRLSSPMGIPLYSARGLTQTLTQVQEGKPPPRYTWNGELRHVGLAALQLYESVITCTDQQAPAFGGLWVGTLVIADCVAELNYLTASGSPEREVVEDSSREVGDYTYYRPRMAFKVVDFDMAREEYKHDYQWRLSLKETVLPGTT